MISEERDRRLSLPHSAIALATRPASKALGQHRGSAARMMRELRKRDYLQA